MAPANERRHPAPAKTAAALLAHYCFLQALWRKRCSCSPSGCACSRRLGCPDFSDWGKAHGLLARLHCRPDLSQLLRHISARAHCHARTTGQRVHRGRDVLCCVRLSAAAASACLVRRILDLLGLRLLDQRFARRPLPGGDSCIAVNFLSRSTGAISRAFAVGICSNLSLDSYSLAYLGGITFSGLFSVSGQYGMVGTSARAHRRDA